MTRWLWRDGHLSWMLVILIVFSTVWMLAFDYAWRLIEAPFEVFLVAGFALWFFGVLVILIVGRRRH